jgi:hypothetical protein
VLSAFWCPGSDSVQAADEGGTEKMKFKMALIGLAATAVGSNNVEAGGEYYFRQLSHTTLGDCPSGQLVERLYDGGNVHGFDNLLFVSCENGTDQASWIFTAGQGCHGQKICNVRKGLQTPPQIFGSGEFWKMKTITFKVLKSAKGSNCHDR